MKEEFQELTKLLNDLTLEKIRKIPLVEKFITENNNKFNSNNNNNVESENINQKKYVENPEEENQEEDQNLKNKLEESN